jgi:nicotinate-nucleotide adenylyltransferase
MAKIGVYGGSFNPPHKGHILAARECLRKLALDEVVLIPASLPPHKRLAWDSPDAETRMELVRLAAAGVPGLTVSDLELRRPGASYTADTLREIRASRPNDEIYLLMGTDMFLSFPTWRSPDEIAKLARLVCFYRGNRSDEMKQALAAQKALIAAQFGQEPVLLENDCIDISSTEIRRMLFFGCTDDNLAPGVYARIERDGLYGTREDCRGLPFEDLKEKSLSLLKPSRVAHVIGCCETAVALARKYGASEIDAARAGILHDVTKALNHDQQLRVCDRYRVPVSDFERAQVKLLHSKTGAAVAKHIFGESDAVCEAIHWHTTGKDDMSVLEKIIYIADYMEPTRAFPGVEQLREAVWRDLDEAVLLGLEMTLKNLESRAQPMAAESVRAREFLLRQRHSEGI